MTRFTSFLNLFFVGLLVIMIALVGYRLFTGRGFFVRTDQATVIKEIRELNRLETSVYTMEKIIEAGTQGNAFQEFLFGDRVLLIAHGSVVAGVDLSLLKAEDITVRGQSVTLRLPETQVFVTDLDETKTRVYDRRQGVLRKGERDLEGEARRVAEAELRQAACDGGILDKAAENAKTQLTAFLNALDFDNVSIEVKAGSCVTPIVD